MVELRLKAEESQAQLEMIAGLKKQLSAIPSIQGGASMVISLCSQLSIRLMLVICCNTDRHTKR